MQLRTNSTKVHQTASIFQVQGKWVERKAALMAAQMAAQKAAKKAAKMVGKLVERKAA
jgi:hypothetical protein